MSKVIFVGDEQKIYDATLVPLGLNQVRVDFNGAEKPEPEIATSGFYIINEYNRKMMADYKSYTYIYRETDRPDWLELCNDGVEYVEPDLPEIKPEPEPAAPTLAEVINAKRAALSASCRASIENGITLLIDGNSEHFSYSLDGGDQSNIDDIFNSMINTGLGQYYHADGGPCKYYSQLDVFNLYAGQKKNKLEHTTYYNMLMQYIMHDYGQAEDTSANRAAVNAIEYLAPELNLPADYLNTYNKIVAADDEIIDAMRGKLFPNGVFAGVVTEE